MNRRRASHGLPWRVLERLLGLELKLRQYELGESFINAIEREAGVRAVVPAWRGPELLPTLAELSAPKTWLARVDGATVVAG